jgi:uroporphyrinogen III methyltransferase / synthase
MVYLVGAGPGDPELITIKGRRVLERATCVLFDNLASRALLKHAPAAAEKIYVGKKKSTHAYSQEEICALLVDRGRTGGLVVRLKGGDPFIFGRGGEEAEALVDAGIPFEVVPGVTSPLGIAAYTGIPLTHRDHTSAVTFVTGHEPARIDWARVGHVETLVVLMGLTSFAEISRRLIEEGRAPDTPAAVVRWGTRPDQETLVGTLSSLPGLIEKSGIKPPATIILGEVVALREKLNWFERLPLFGQKVVVTRATNQAAALSGPLAELGAEVVEIPAIEIQPSIWQLEDPGQYDWIVFTSANGVRCFLDRISDVRALRGKICAIGPATRSTVESARLTVELIGEEYVAESLLAAFASYDLNGKKILIARAAVARDVLPQGLRARGALVDVLEVYRTVVPQSLSDARLDGVDWVTFTSSSTVENLVQALGCDRLKGIKTASIGPITSSALKRVGLDVAVEAKEYTIGGLVKAILSFTGVG